MQPKEKSQLEMSRDDELLQYALLNKRIPFFYRLKVFIFRLLRRAI